MVFIPLARSFFGIEAITSQSFDTHLVSLTPLAAHIFVNLGIAEQKIIKWTQRIEFDTTSKNLERSATGRLNRGTERERKHLLCKK